MGVTYHIEFDGDLTDSTFESRALPNASDQLDVIVNQLGLLSHFELFSYAAQNHLCYPEDQETEIPWYDAQTGLDWLEAVMKHIRSTPDSVANTNVVLSDLSRAHDLLLRAKDAGLKWHFAMDF